MVSGLGLMNYSVILIATIISGDRDAYLHFIRKKQGGCETVAKPLIPSSNQARVESELVWSLLPPLVLDAEFTLSSSPGFWSVLLPPLTVP